MAINGFADKQILFKFDMGYYNLHKEELLKNKFKIVWDDLYETIFVLYKVVDVGKQAESIVKTI